MVDTFLTLPESDYLLSVHGVGVITAAKILSEIGAESPTKSSKPDTDVQATKQPVQAVNDDGKAEPSEDYFQSGGSHVEKNTTTTTE